MYTWNPEQEFKIKGSDLALVNAIIESNVNDPNFQNRINEAQRVMLIIDGQKMFQEILKKGVEDGTIMGGEGLTTMDMGDSALGDSK